MEILELEQKYSELKSALSEINSTRNRLLLIADYFSFVLPNGNTNILEAYIIEFMPDYLSYIEFLEIRGLNPEVLSKLQSQLKILVELNFANVSKDDVSRSSIALDEKLKAMYKWLNDDPPNQSDSKIYFPVLEKKESGFGNGYLESLNVQIKNGEQKFYITPSEYNGDEQLEKQITLCFSTAINYCKKFFRKIKQTHTIYLHFEDKLGIYSGNSLGIALTLVFIEAILKHYNSTIALTVNRRIAITGGIDNNSKIISTSKAIIEIKVETVFFSDAQIFCVPKIDEMWAEEKLKKLQTEYPKRNLKIIGLTDLNDLLDRRQIVDIKKQKLVVRTVKFVKKNWISAAATLLLAILFAYLFVMDFDDNPTSLYADGTKLFVKNKNGKVLWALNINLNIDILVYPELIKNYAKIIDIDNDNENELLFIQTALDERNVKQGRGTIICFDKYQKIKWEYTFQDTVFSERENLQPLYNAYLIDTATIENRKVLYSYANNSTSFSSAIFTLDLNNGERIKNTQWNSGYTWDAIMIDVEEDGEKEIVGMGADNGLKAAVIWGMKLKNVNGYRPTTLNYMIKNFDETDLKFYIRIPNTDYDSLSGARSSGMLPGTLVYDKIEKNIRFTAISTLYPNTGLTINTFHYSLNYKRMDFDIFLIDKFSSKRDSLVTIGKLNIPYTDTKEYKEILKNSILYFKDGKWVNRKELIKYE